MTRPEDSRVVGRVPFVDGVTRDVYELAGGRQWIARYDGERVYGVWLVPADEPVIVVPDRADHFLSNFSAFSSCSMAWSTAMRASARWPPKS